MRRTAYDACCKPSLFTTPEPPRDRHNANDRPVNSWPSPPSLEANHAADQTNRCVQQTPLVFVPCGAPSCCFLRRPLLSAKRTCPTPCRPKPRASLAQAPFDRKKSTRMSGLFSSQLRRPVSPTWRPVYSTHAACLFDSTSLTALKAPRGRARGCRHDRSVIREVEVRQCCSYARSRIRDWKLGVLERHSRVCSAANPSDHSLLLPPSPLALSCWVETKSRKRAIARGGVWWRSCLLFGSSNAPAQNATRGRREQVAHQNPPIYRERLRGQGEAGDQWMPRNGAIKGSPGNRHFVGIRGNSERTPRYTPTRQTGLGIGRGGGKSRRWAWFQACWRRMWWLLLFPGQVFRLPKTTQGMYRWATQPSDSLHVHRVFDRGCPRNAAKCCASSPSSSYTAARNKRAESISRVYSHPQKHTVCKATKPLRIVSSRMLPATGLGSWTVQYEQIASA